MNIQKRKTNFGHCEIGFQSGAFNEISVFTKVTLDNGQIYGHVFQLDESLKKYLKELLKKK